MKNYNTNNIIKTIRYGIGVNEDDVEDIIKKHIDKGIPVTMYNAGGIVAGVSDHYCNIYGYVIYEGTKAGDVEPSIEQTLLMVRINFTTNHKISRTFYVDPAFLNSWGTGLIGYDIIYNTHSVNMLSFINFVDENNSQFVNTIVNEDVFVNSNFTINTNRLRSYYKSSCGKDYLILTSITESEDEEYIVYDPYIELNTEDYTDVGAIDIKLLRLDSEDVFSTDDEILIEGYNTNTSTWETLKTISPSELETLDEIEDSYPAPSFIDAYNNIKNYRIYVYTYGIEKIRISLDAKYIDNNTNRRDIAIVSLDVHLNTRNASISNHVHEYNDCYAYYEAPHIDTHYAYCYCGEKILELHQKTIVNADIVCELCGYVIQAHTHNYVISRQGSVDYNVHRYICTCGNSYEEPHTIVGGPVAHETKLCTTCEAIITYNHIYGDHYDTPTETTHKTYCICGDFQTVSHEYTEIEYEDDSYHIKYCICGAYIVEEHDYTHNYLKNSSLNHKSYCACGDYILQSHAISPSDVGMNFANCMFCLCLLDLRNDFGEIEPNNISVDILTSDNGSYILPSGIIVLVDNDIIAYMNGTLVFRKDEDNEIM